MITGVSIPKNTGKNPNEDSYVKTDDFFAVSDGAGGCGVFSDKWSDYLVNHLPEKTPLTDAEEFDKWLDDICDTFYVQCEEIAKGLDPMFLNKFYKEGTFATLAAVWKISSNECKCITYGDSVVFHYDYKTKELEHSFTKLSDFSNPPYLINVLEPITKSAFKTRTFTLTDSSVIFAATDALSHYILMMYMASKLNVYENELKEIISKQNPNSRFVSLAIDQVVNFDEVLNKLICSVQNEKDFESSIRELNLNGLIDIDDYTLVVLK